MRHGTTVWNEKGITQGRSNNRLSASGKALTEKVAKEFENVKFDVIFCSPIMRTVQTANIMNKYHNTKIIKDERLTEIDQGKYTGWTKKNYTEKDWQLRAKRDESCGMESYQSVEKRARQFFQYIMKENKYENILIITHNVTASLLENIIKGIKIDFSNDKHLRCFKNAEIKHLMI